MDYEGFTLMNAHHEIYQISQTIFLNCTLVRLTAFKYRFHLPDKSLKTNFPITLSKQQDSADFFFI